MRCGSTRLDGGDEDVGDFHLASRGSILLFALPVISSECRSHTAFCHAPGGVFSELVNVVVFGPNHESGFAILVEACDPVLTSRERRVFILCCPLFICNHCCLAAVCVHLNAPNENCWYPSRGCSPLDTNPRSCHRTSSAC